MEAGGENLRVGFHSMLCFSKAVTTHRASLQAGTASRDTACKDIAGGHRVTQAWRSLPVPVAAIQLPVFPQRESA
ncbi:hypothetical protein [Noviherbaspirillum aerium]|uniref:hypothetical protein n=1 Tax=Noviherbaspirillum aerium TaxID=2588497 RepID=UPI00124DB233|nr:hypothetical protein [Noviherbaspirillum aerium]